MRWCGEADCLREVFPEFRAQPADCAAREQMGNHPLPAEYLCHARHSCFERTIFIIEPALHENLSFSSIFQSDGRNAGNLSLECQIWIPPYLYGDGIALADIGDFLLRNRHLDDHHVEIDDFTEGIPLLDIFPDALLKMWRGDNPC